MPANYGIPPWLQGQDIPGSFLKGAQLGQEQARMEQESQRLQVQSQQAQQQTLQEQQRLEIQHQYQQQQIALQHQELQQARQMNQIKIQAAARQAQASMAYQSEVDAIDQRTDLTPDQKQQLKLGSFQKHGPDMTQDRFTGTGAWLSSMAKPQAFVPRTVDLGGGHQVFESAPNKFEEFGSGKNAPIPESQKLLGGAYEEGLKKAQEALTIAQQTGKPKLIESAKAQVKEFTDKIEGLGKPGGGGEGGTKVIKPVLDPATNRYVIPGAKTGTTSASSSAQSSAQAQAPAQAQPASFDQLKSAIASVDPKKRGDVMAKAMQTLSSELVKAADIPKKWGRLQVGGSSIYHDPADTFFGALVHGSSNGVTSKEVMDTFDAQSPETQKQIMGKAMAAAGLDVPATAQPQAQVPQSYE